MKKFLSIIFLLSICPVDFASMAVPLKAVNETTKECATFGMGDECMTCSVPAGWKALEFGENCPDGYAVVEAQSECKRRKGPFCCTAGHSGGNGDCADLIVNASTKQCAFVDDIQRCGTLLAGWERADDTDASENRLCPVDYKWLDNVLACGQEN